jgi:hypothetical protein
MHKSSIAARRGPRVEAAAAGPDPFGAMSVFCRRAAHKCGQESMPRVLTTTARQMLVAATMRPLQARCDKLLVSYAASCAPDARHAMPSTTTNYP